MKTDPLEIELRLLARGDQAAVLAFARELPEHDLLFLSRDLTHEKVVRAWIDATEEGRIHSLVAWAQGAIAGYSALVNDPLSWSPHVGEIRIMVAERYRGHGVGRQLAQETLARAIELGLDKLCASMTTDQYGAIAVFEELGFRGEAILRDHVRTRDGRTYDLAILSHDVGAVAARHALMGLTN